LVDLTGKHGRIRSVPIPEWAHVAVAEWTRAAGITAGTVIRSITRHGHIKSRPVSPQGVFEIVKSYAQALGVSIGPHDLRRSFARLAHLGQAPVEQIQLSLGHASVITTELYLGVKQDLIDAPCDRLGLSPTGSEKIAFEGVDQT
jgi:site-specific recombinase XerD